ncbi:MAG: helix-turn-helix transcriptional regulator, partial [bacterium]
KLKNKEFRKVFELERAKVSLAQKIAELRKESNLKQADLAKKMHVSQQFISQIETAQEINLTLDTLISIAKSLNRCIKISFEKDTGGKVLFIK